MFGESDSDSPHVGSPWDSLLSSSASLESELKHRLQRSSRLSPEIEEGNVEYKLKLIDPTPERFARLVTQLKWRLLEGSGQAYYELGVADSGQLVGLCRTELEATLETLEAMAGEIGASVIIVREIEVPAMRTLKEGLLGAAIGGGVDFSQVDGAMRLPRRRHLLLVPSDESDGEAETPETDLTSTDEPLTADERAESAGDLVTMWPSQSAPALDDDAIFDIEVSSVYKPLPSLRRAHTAPATPRKDKSASKEKTKAAKPIPDPVARALERKAKRDARRNNRRREILGDDDSSPDSAFDMSAVAAALPQPELDPPPEGTSQLLHMLYLLFLPIHAFLNRLWNAWDSAQNSTALVNPDARSNPTSEATPGADAQSEGSESSSEWLSDESEQCIPTTQKRFKKAFARDVKVHFVGAWDTVSSVGLVRDKTLPGTTDGMSHVCYFRHALALHERRVKFLPEFVNGGLGPASLRDKVVRVLDSIAEDDGGPFDALSLVRLVLSTLASTAAGLLYTKPTAPTSEGDHAIADAEPERPGQHPRGMSASQITQKPDIDAPPPHTKEVWFPGSHSDIGGGASPNENMRKFGPALRWMSFEARLAGLKISKEPRRWDTELRRTNSLTPFWKMIELLPVKRLTYDSVSGTTYRPHLWAKRPFQSGQLVYDAVSERTKKLLCEAGLEVEDDPYLGAEDFLKSLDQYIENRDILSERDRIKLHLLSNGALGQQQLRDLSDDISGPLSTMLSICRDKIEDPRALSVASTIQLLLYGLEYSFDVLRNSRPLHAALELSMVEDTWTFPRPLRAHVAPVRTVACTHGGARIVSGAWDDSIRVWDTATGEQIRPPIEGSEFDVDSIAVSPDGRRAVMTPYQAASALKVWDLDEGICLLLLVGHVDRIYCAAYSQDGWYIASGSSDGIIIWDAETGERLGDNLAFGSPPTTIFTVAFSNDGRYLAAGDSNCTIYLWDVVTRTLSFALLGHNQGVRSIMFSPDDKRLVSGSDDGSVRIWRVDTREVAHVLTGHTSNVWAVAFSPKGRHVASASGDGSVRVWSADSGKPVGVPLEGHNSDVRCVAFSPDGSRVVSGADDGAIRIWDRMPSIPLADRSALRDYAYPVDMLIPPAVVYPPADPANISLPPSEAGNVQEEAANAAGPSEHGDHLPDYRHHKDGEVIMQTDKDLTSENDDSETHEDGALSPVSSASKDTSSIHDGSAASQGTDFCKNRNPESTQSGIHSAPEHGPRPCSSPERRGAPERSRPAL